MLAPDPKPSNDYYGHFATMSRLIGTLVSESMIPAYFVPNLFDEIDNGMQEGPHGRTVTGFCFLTNLPHDRDVHGFRLENIYAFAALRGMPELHPHHSIDINGHNYRSISLLHPWDILPYIYGPPDNIFSFQFPDAPELDCSFLHDTEYIRNKALQTIGALGLPSGVPLELREGYDSIRLWRRYAYNYNIPAMVADMCASWFHNSSQFQTHIYNNPCPLPNYLTTSTHWENCVMEGHPLFPISRTMRSLSPLPPLTPPDFTKLLQRTKVRLVAVPEANVGVCGNFVDKTRNLVDHILGKNGNAAELRQSHAGHIFIPVHDFQVPNIRAKIRNAHIFPEENHALAYGLSSIRTVAAPGVIDGKTMKLSLGIELASIIRTIPYTSAVYGYRFSTEVVPHLSYNRDVLTIQTESACAYYQDAQTSDEDAKHLCCILRDSEEVRVTSTNDSFAVCAALVEKIQRPDTSQTLVRHVWKLNTEERRIQFLDSYIELFFGAIIPPCRDNGIAFECHAQNTILRFNRITGALKGFLIRDLCDMQVHRETATATMGQRVADVFPREGYNHATTLDQVYVFLYYGAIYIHLQTLIRVLDMHYNGTGWAIARRHFMALVQDQEHPMFDFFIRRDQVPIRSYTRTRLMNTTVNNAFFDNILKPNLLHIGMPDEQRAALEAERIRRAAGSQASSSQTPYDVPVPADPPQSSAPEQPQASSSKGKGKGKAKTTKKKTPSKKKTASQAAGSQDSSSESATPQLRKSARLRGQAAAKGTST